MKYCHFHCNPGGIILNCEMLCTRTRVFPDLKTLAGGFICQGRKMHNSKRKSPGPDNVKQMKQNFILWYSTRKPLLPLQIGWFPPSTTMSRFLLEALSTLTSNEGRQLDEGRHGTLSAWHYLFTFSVFDFSSIRKSSTLISLTPCSLLL